MTEKQIKIDDLVFELSIDANTIQSRVKEIAIDMNQKLVDKNPVFLGVLNGAFMFAGDLFRLINFPCQITFLKLASYDGINSSGNVKQLIGINQNLKGRTVVILEDIVDTGVTLDTLIRQINDYEPKEIIAATILHKPDALVKNVKLDYVGFEIPNDFVVGYGLDYNGYGRNLPEIFSLIKD